MNTKYWKPLFKVYGLILTLWIPWVQGQTDPSPVPLIGSEELADSKYSFPIFNGSKYVVSRFSVPLYNILT